MFTISQSSGDRHTQMIMDVEYKFAMYKKTK